LNKLLRITKNISDAIKVQMMVVMTLSHSISLYHLLYQLSQILL